METPKRTRASTVRTKNGCATCRQRRIRCDEGRPSCQRCMRSGWNCPGYAQSGPSGTTTSLVPPRTCSSPSGSITSSAINQYSLPFRVPGTQEDRRSLHYFSNFAVADLSGFVSCEFWSRTILQRCQHDAPLRYAAVALGRAHMEYITASDSDPFSLCEKTTKAYGKAVKALRNYLGRRDDPDPGLVLMCSAVFFSYELIRGERGEALRHLRCGLKVLSQWRKDAPKVTDCGAATREELAAIFARLDLQATMFDEGRKPAIELGDKLVKMGPIKGLQEAQSSISILLHHAMGFLTRNWPYKSSSPENVPEAVRARRRELLISLDAWARNIDTFEQQQDTLEVATASLHDQRRALAVCKLHFRIIRLLLLHSLQDVIKETAPSFDQEARLMLQLATEAIEHHSHETGAAASETRDSTRCFSLHLGVIAPIFLLALKAEDLSVRHSAIGLLRAVKGRREGFYDADLMARTVLGLAREEAEGRVRLEPGVSRGQEVQVAVTPALEYKAEIVMGIRSYEQDMERLGGIERLLAVAG